MTWLYNGREDRYRFADVCLVCLLDQGNQGSLQHVYGDNAGCSLVVLAFSNGFVK